MSKSKKPVDPHFERESTRYENPIPSREYILRCFTEIDAQPSELNFRELVSALDVKGQDSRSALRKRLKAMLRDDQLEERGANYRVFVPRDDIEGVVQGHRDGYGFVLVPDGEDVFLSAREMRQIFHGDKVKVRVLGKGRRDGLEGQVLEVLQRNTSQVVGRLNREGNNWSVFPDNPRMGHRISVNAQALQGAKIGDYVVVDLVDYPSAHSETTGRIAEVLGEPMGPGVEIDVAIRSFDIPHHWPDEVLQAASQLSAEPAESDKTSRVDLRQLPLVTIDGEDARDFDDAVYCEATKGGGFKLWVAIADVSHYVGVGSALDLEANTRGTSVYFPGRVVPMLPEAISNGLCSLNPEVDRLCMVCEMEISTAGVVDHYEFYEAVIHSHARLTYTEVAAVLDKEHKNDDGDTLDGSLLPKRIQFVLNTLYALYEVLQVARSKRGAIEFETTETQIIFNAQRKIEDIVPVQRNDAHKIIEECMLCANVAAANFLSDAGLDGLYRVHQGPKPEKLENLRSYLGELGLSLAGGEKPQPQHYLQLMEKITGLPNAHLIQIMMLRSLSQAVYDPENEGHFGLAYDAYAHFTSPIRRYPDLLVHRALKHVIRSRKSNSHVRRVESAKNLAKKSIYPYDKNDMLALGAHCSMAERRADDATRDVTAWLKCEYLKDRTGEDFIGVVAGVANFGLFVELKDIYVEGLVHITQLGNDYFHYDAHAQRLVGERTRRVYQLGDTVEVRVVEVNLDDRKINLELSSESREPKSRKVAKRSNSKKPSNRKRRSKKTNPKELSAKKDSSCNTSEKSAKRKSAGKPTEKSAKKVKPLTVTKQPRIKAKASKNKK